MSDFSVIFNRMMARASDDRDKRSGAIIYDTLAPTAMELSEFLLVLRVFADQMSIMSASGRNLDDWAENFGITRYSAVAAVRLTEFADSAGELFDPPLGSRFSPPNIAGGLAFALTEMHEPGIGRLECEVPGESGNEYSGLLLPLATVNNLGTALMLGTYRPGQNRETDTALRKRLIDHIRRKAFGGNVADYKRFVRDIAGVGDVKVFPVWNNKISPSMLMPPPGFWEWAAEADGMPAEALEYIRFMAECAERGVISTGGTVLISIVDGQHKPVSAEFAELVQTEVDPVANGGEGLGTAPIGHRVTVVTPETLEIDISADLYIRPGFTVTQVQGPVEEAIDDYIAEVREAWADSDNLRVFTSRVITAMHGVQGIENVSDVALNGDSAYVSIPQTVDLQQVPVLGKVELTVV